MKLKRRHPLYLVDWWLITPVLFLVIISLTILFSINPAFFENQLLALGVGFVAFLFFSQFPFRDLLSFSRQIYFISLILLIIVLIIGFEAKGAVRWIEIFGVSLQLSEITKPFLSVTFVYFLSKSENRDIRTYLLALIGFLPITFLIYKQPDLGNALIYLIVGIFVFLLYGIPLLWLFFMSLPVILASPLIWNVLHDYQRQRILTFLHPLDDPQGSSYNLIQAVIAVGSGMFLGKGLGEGTQSQLLFLPENHTDFMFASMAEKLGFLGTSIVLMAFVWLFWRIYLVYQSTEDMASKLFAGCAMLFIVVHFFVNIGMNIGIVPVVGVTLPFLSYGGSSLLSNFIFLGMLSNISVNSRKRETLQIR